MGNSLRGKYMVGKNPPIDGQNCDGYKSRWGFFLMGKIWWVKLHDGYKSTVSIPRWAFVFEKMCDGQIADGEYPGNPVGRLDERLLKNKVKNKVKKSWKAPQIRQSGKFGSGILRLTARVDVVREDRSTRSTLNGMYCLRHWLHTFTDYAAYPANRLPRLPLYRISVSVAQACYFFNMFC